MYFFVYFILLFYIIIIIVVYYVRRLERRWILGPTDTILSDWLKLHVLVTWILASVREEFTYTSTASPYSEFCLLKRNAS